MRDIKIICMAIIITNNYNTAEPFQLKLKPCKKKKKKNKHEFKTKVVGQAVLFVYLPADVQVIVKGLHIHLLYACGRRLHPLIWLDPPSLFHLIPPFIALTICQRPFLLPVKHLWGGRSQDYPAGQLTVKNRFTDIITTDMSLSVKIKYIYISQRNLSVLRYVFKRFWIFYMIRKLILRHWCY